MEHIEEPGAGGGHGRGGAADPEEDSLGPRKAGQKAGKKVGKSSVEATTSECLAVITAKHCTF